MFRNLGLVMLLILAGCQPAAAQLTPVSVCRDIAAVQAAPDAARALASVNEHSALGVLWADVQSGCQGVMATPGVDVSWTQAIWQMTKGLIPVVLPYVVPLPTGIL